MPSNTCIACRHWRAPPGAKIGESGICRSPARSASYTEWVRTAAGDTCEDWMQLAFYKAQDGSLAPDRRGTARTEVDFPARLQTTGGDWSGRLCDFSETGARLRLTNPPRAGTQALLKCGSDEIFCKIAWSIDDACGLAFDRPVPRTLVLEIAGNSHADSVPAMAVADPRKIPEGKKRMRLSHVSQAAALVAEAQDGEGMDSGENVLPFESPQTPPPAAGSFESRDADGYIKFYPFRAMANP